MTSTLQVAVADQCLTINTKIATMTTIDDATKMRTKVTRVPPSLRVVGSLPRGGPNLLPLPPPLVGANLPLIKNVKATVAEEAVKAVAK